MGLRPRRRNLVVLSTRAVPAPLPRARESTRLARTRTRRRFRFLRIGALLAAIRLARTMRTCWRLSVGLAGLLLEIIGITLLSGPAQSAADFAGMALILFALLRNTDPASGRRTAFPQATWHRHG